MAPVIIVVNIVAVRNIMHGLEHLGVPLFLSRTLARHDFVVIKNFYKNDSPEGRISLKIGHLKVGLKGEILVGSFQIPQNQVLRFLDTNSQ